MARASTKKKAPPKPKRQKVVKPTKRAEVTALYTKDGHIVCGACLSKPSVQMRVEYDIAGKWGYGMRHLSDGLQLPSGEVLDAQVTFYPCSNPACFTNVLVFNESGKPGREGHERIRMAFPLSPEQQTRYDRGMTDRRGVWHETKSPEPSRG